MADWERDRGTVKVGLGLWERVREVEKDVRVRLGGLAVRLGVGVRDWEADWLWVGGEECVGVGEGGDGVTVEGVKLGLGTGDCEGVPEALAVKEGVGDHVLVGPVAVGVQDPEREALEVPEGRGVGDRVGDAEAEAEAAGL